MTAFRSPATRPPATDRSSAADVAEAAVAAWTVVYAALSPVVGARGTLALYRRTLFLAAAAHPWLLPVYTGATEPGDFSSLRSAMAAQEAAHGAIAQKEMLDNLHELLVRLIGSSLTQRLLPSLRRPQSAGDAVQDSSP